MRNSGSRAGVVVPQIYVRDQFASLVRPVKELKGFARLQLAAGETRTVLARIPVDMLNFTGYSGQRIVEPGDFEIMVGEHSADIRLRAVVTVNGTVRTLGRDWRMESSVA